MWAAAENNAAVVKLLVEAGADVRERSRGGVFSPLLFAVRGGHVATALALLDAGAPVDDALPDGTSALVLAVVNAHYELAAALLDRGADPNAVGPGLDGAAPDRLVAAPQRRVQSAWSGADRRPRQPRSWRGSWWRAAPTSTRG